MIMRTNRQLVIGTVVSPILVAGCVKKSKYEALEAENRQLQQQVATQSAQISAEKAQVGRLQGRLLDRCAGSGSRKQAQREQKREHET